MTDAKKRRTRRRRFKAHTLGISDRHNPGLNFLKKRERQRVERRDHAILSLRAEPKVERPQIPTGAFADERPPLAEQLQRAIDEGLLPSPEDA